MTLSKKDMDAIYTLYHNNDISIAKLAKMYGVSNSIISLIIRNKRDSIK